MLSPLKLNPPVSPRRPPSPVMSPGTRRGRAMASTDESHLRDLSPDTTLRAFSQRPMPYDTTLDEYKIFKCIDTLTPAERDLGVRVAKAAQRLKSWGEELAQWGWTGTFEEPTEQIREQRRKSLELRIKEHVKVPDTADMPSLEYWGSLLSVEVEAHEARLDAIGDDLLALDIEELKGHVLDMHPAGRSRPPSAGIGGARRDYTPMDDFSFLITQTLIAALPHHVSLKERLGTWTARVTILREAPRFLANLKTAQNAMRMGWEALRPPEDTSDEAFNTWKSSVETISSVLQERVGSIGRLLDRWLDTLEGRHDCLPDKWIDTFERVETDFAQWTHVSHSKIIMFDVQRNSSASQSDAIQTPRLIVDSPTSPAFVDHVPQYQSIHPDVPDDESVFEEGDTVVHNEVAESFVDEADEEPGLDSSAIITTTEVDYQHPARPRTPQSRRASIGSFESDVSLTSSPPMLPEDSPSFNRAVKTPRPALNAAMNKRRSKVPGELTVESAPWPPTQFSHKSPHSADDLDRKISDILTTIPAHIRLTTRNGADARDRRTSRGLASKGSQGLLRAQRSFSGMKSPEMTLSPAKQDLESANAFSGRKSSSAMRGDNDIKLYHLTQPGREHPQKLFIRRVGENGERVMVRVGGGWADLGEYLRQYAEHHGRRTVSSEKFEILGLELPNVESSPGRSESAMSSRRDRRFSGGTQIGSPATTPVKAIGRGIPQDEPPPPMPNFTPVQTGSSNETSSPSTGSSKASWKGTEVGLAGPTSKKLDLSNDKLEWIEGMMKQARSVSGGNLPAYTPPVDRPRTAVDSRSESRSTTRNESRAGTRNENRKVMARKQKSQEFGALGRVGGTKRIFMKGGGLGNEH